ncbi:MAG: glycosyltransferase family 4 protein [Flavobacteriales bacterium]|nr:glycosyltransferase family 4 protein [Flavobacteriales bacterium]
MKILLLTQYYPPETGAPQNRLSALARHLKMLGEDVEVLTAMPNYPAMRIFPGYEKRWYTREVVDGIKVHRAWIYVTGSKSIVPRLMNYFSFVFSSAWIGLSKLPRYDVVICESPPLFLGMSAWLMSRFRKAKMVFNVSDLWPESAEKLGLVTNPVILKLATWLEEGLYKSSWKVSGQTQGIVSDIVRRFPKKDIYLFRNGVDTSAYQDIHSDASWRSDIGLDKDCFVAVYAGIIGHAQGLDVILDAGKSLSSEKKIAFVLVGSGPEKDRLQERIRKEQIGNVHILDARSRAQVIGLISGCDAAVIPLKKQDLFLGAIPSKIFEALALKKPILLGVDGEARTLFIEEGKSGLYFEPENSDALAKQVLALKTDPALLGQLGRQGNEFVMSRFGWDEISKGFHKWLYE